MEPIEFLEVVTRRLEQLGLAYLVTGSTATVAYGEPRFTNDIDVVVVLEPRHIDAFCAAFPEPEFDCPRAMVADSVLRRFPFNILHPDSGLKADVIPATDSEFDRPRLGRAVRVPGGTDFAAWFASPEDVIVRKLQYYREGGSEKHVRDILGVLKVCGERIDREYVAAWAGRPGAAEEWQLVLSRAGDPPPR